MSFDLHYRRDVQIEPLPQDLSTLTNLERGAAGFTQFISTRAGTSYNKGVYRIHCVGEMSRWTEIVSEAFPQCRERIFCFGYDWLGRHFALDFLRKVRGHFLVLMLEPGTGQSLEIPANFMDFHDIELVQHQNEALASDFYHSWLSAGGKAPSLSECVSYKKPLFLGGGDILENLEVTDMEVYWCVVGQLLTKVRGLPDGTRVGDVRIGD